MPTITITIPNPILNRVIDAYAYQHGYQDEIPSVDPVTRRDTKIPNPETKNQFVRRMLIRHIKQAVRAHEARLAENVARQAAHDSVESEINLTVA